MHGFESMRAGLRGLFDKYPGITEETRKILEPSLEDALAKFGVGCLLGAAPESQVGFVGSQQTSCGSGFFFVAMRRLLIDLPAAINPVLNNSIVAGSGTGTFTAN